MKVPTHLVWPAALALVTACHGEATTPSEPLVGELLLTVVSGNDQVGAPGEELSEPLVAVVTNSKGHAIRDMVVNFRVVSGGGSVFAGTTASDKSGRVADYWTLGSYGTQVVEVRTVDPTTGEKQTWAIFNATFSTPPPPPPPPPSSDQDGDGFTIAAGDCDDTNPAINPGAIDDPDPAFVDLNCDGVDGDVSGGVFVAPTGNDLATCGNLSDPCATIGFGIGRAVVLTRPRVYIAAGTYSEAVVLASGVSLHGGYSSDFLARSLAMRATINGAATYATGGITYTMLGENLTQVTTVDALIIDGADAVGPQANGSGKHAAAVLLRSIGAGVFALTQSQVMAGNGTIGSAGANGLDNVGGIPPSASAGQNGSQYTVFCDDVSRGAGGSGSGIGSQRGGTGGSGGTMDSDCGGLIPNTNARPGDAGGNAQVWGFGFGTGGPGGAGGLVCANGQPGVNGRLGQHGSNGVGGGSPAVVSGFLFTPGGGSGSPGAIGTGGGGGGGSGGCDAGTDSYGAGGGGGGSGGASATLAGLGGKGGGASVAIYLSAASATISAVDITRGVGGSGGNGGDGGAGQAGSAGGVGGTGVGTGNGGNGGNGGSGGNSGAGGGGAGGLSTGILGVNSSSVSATAVSYFSGLGGQGGDGGLRPDGSSGGTGTTGTLSTSLIIP